MVIGNAPFKTTQPTAPAHQKCLGIKAVAGNRVLRLQKWHSLLTIFVSWLPGQQQATVSKFPTRWDACLCGLKQQCLLDVGILHLQLAVLLQDHGHTFHRDLHSQPLDGLQAWSRPGSS